MNGRYRAQLDRVLKDANCDEYLEVSRQLQARLEPRRAECTQTEGDFPLLIGHAAALHAQFSAFLDMLASKSGAVTARAPLKGPWRALEKMVLRPKHEVGGALDAKPLCDCLRGALNCRDFTMISSVVELLLWLDDEFGDEARVENIEARFRIHLIRIKCGSRHTQGQPES